MVDETCGGCGGKEEWTQGFGEKPVVQRPLPRPKLRSEVNIKMDLKGIAWGRGLH